MQTYDRDIILNKITRALNVILKAIVIVIFIFPFYWMVSTSLKDLTEALQFPPTLIPSSFHWENFSAGTAVSDHCSGSLQPVET